MKYKYHIFISYKYGKPQVEVGAKYLGVSVARALKQSLEMEGYKVYCDVDSGGAPDSISKLRESRIVLVLLTGYSFDDRECYFVDELTKISNLIQENPKNKDKKKPRVLAVNIDGTFKEDVDYGDIVFNIIRDFEKWCHLTLHTGQQYQSDMRFLINRIKNPKMRREGNLNVKPRFLASFYGMRKILQVLLPAFLLSITMLPILWVDNCQMKHAPHTYGDGVVPERLKQLGVWSSSRISFDNVYPTDYTLFNNAIWVEDNESETGRCPILFYVGEMPNKESAAEKHPEWFGENSRIRSLLEFYLDSVELVAYIFADTSTANGQIVNKPKDLMKILNDDTNNYYVMCGVGGTRGYFSEKAGDSIYIDSSIIKKDFHPYNTKVKDIIEKIKRTGKTVVVLENRTIEADTGIMNRVTQCVRLGKYMYLYAYTLVEVIEGKENVGASFRFEGNQEILFDKLGKRGYTKINLEDRDEKGKVKKVLNREINPELLTKIRVCENQ